MVINGFPKFPPTNLFFSLNESRLLFFYIVATIICFALRRKTNWFKEIRDTK